MFFIPIGPRHRLKALGGFEIPFPEWGFDTTRGRARQYFVRELYLVRRGRKRQRRLYLHSVKSRVSASGSDYLIRRSFFQANYQGITLYIGPSCAEGPPWPVNAIVPLKDFVDGPI